MNAFGGGNASEPTSPSRLYQAKIEMEMYTDMFNRMTDMCFRKCKFKYSDAELNVGEMSCTDRCVGKYMEVHKNVADVMQQLQQQMNGSVPQ